MISIGIALYNEADSLKELLLELDATLNTLTEESEILIINDGSTDSTLSLLRSFAQQYPRLRFESFPSHQGQHRAVERIFEIARGECVFLMDGDLQHTPSDIPGFLRKMQAGHSFVCGYRPRRADPLLRSLLASIGNFCFRILSGHEIHDSGCGMRALKKDLARNLKFNHPAEIAIFPLKILEDNPSLKVENIPIQHRPRVSGHSKYNFWNYNFVAARLFLWWWLKRSPLVLALFFLPLLLGGLDRIGGHDESWYLSAGRFFFGQHGLPLLAFNPLVAAVTWLAQMPFAHQATWFSSSYRVIQLLLLAGVLFYAAKNLLSFPKERRWLGLAVLIALPIIPQYFVGASNICSSLFAVLLGLSFADVFHALREEKAPPWKSFFFLAAAVFVRADALVILLLLFVCFCFLKSPFKRISVLRAGTSVLMAVCSVAFYVTFSGHSWHEEKEAYKRRSYQAFEQAQGVLYPQNYSDFAQTHSISDTRSLYGSPESNDFSSWRAVHKNPQAFRDRLKLNLVRLPGLFASTLSTQPTLLGARKDRFSALIFLILLLSGFIHFRSKGTLLGVTFCYVAPSLGYFMSAFQSRYLLQYMLVFLTLSLFGLSRVLFRSQRSSRYLYVFLGLLALSWSTGRWVDYFRYRGRSDAAAIQNVVDFLSTRLPANSEIASSTPKFILAANQKFVHAVGVFSAPTREEVAQWFQRNSVEAILVDPSLRRGEGNFIHQVEELQKNGFFIVGYEDMSAGFKVLLRSDP